MRRLIVVHVEDDQGDALLLKKACEVADLPVEVHSVLGGAEAIAYLTGVREYADRARHPLPNVLVLDLKMAGMNGYEFLRWVRTESRFRALPVLVFTRLDAPADRERAMAAGATGYFVKPVDFESIVRLAESLRPGIPNVGNGSNAGLH